MFHHFFAVVTSRLCIALLHVSVLVGMVAIFGTQQAYYSGTGMLYCKMAHTRAAWFG